MHYEEINKRNKDRMKGTIRSGPKMEWVDDEFMADLLGQVPKVKNTNDDRDVTAEIKHLKCLLSKYNFITTDRQSFINTSSIPSTSSALLPQFWTFSGSCPLRTRRSARTILPRWKAFLRFTSETTAR